MANTLDGEELSSPASETMSSGEGFNSGGCLLWLLGGLTLSFTTVLSLVLFVGLMASLALNAYLGWQLAGLEVTISQKQPTMQVIVVTPTPQLGEVEPAATAAPPPEPIAGLPLEPTATATPLPAGAQVEAQVGTVAAIATQVAAPGDEAAAFSLPTATPAAPVGIDPTPPAALAPPPAGPTPVTPPTPVPPADSAPVQQAAVTSNNSYEIIPIDGERESRPAAEHGDLNLKLRDPQPIDATPELIDIDGSGIDPNAPNFSTILDPTTMIQTYTIHDWDWAANAKGPLTTAELAVLAGFKTPPGQPVYIPKTQTPIWEDDIYATVLYAAEDTLTIMYDKRGNVVKGYTVHYLGLQTDPNLIKAFEESEGSNLPGLTLDTPVGLTTDELIVAIRDNGTFLDVRSRKDWWD